ncbi:NACHT domain- and WD repeat-containing protein 1-like isoform X2 [Lineus longissimus]|uniref:NACHT domain- and WD repeat-containing protein 1-like isoform X2 n=1 Tax=Lineus longissimus TaxID=88925 RepID=UPI00315C5ADF
MYARAKQAAIQNTNRGSSRNTKNAPISGNTQSTAGKKEGESQGINKAKPKKGLGREDIVSAALSSKIDVEYPSLVKIVRIFTSSTFTDTREERNSLMKYVYPNLSTFCRERGYEFQVVDMRWGVRDEATEDHMTSELCMHELRECQRLSTGPNFVTFLGQKYGYRPFPPKIQATEFKKLLSVVKKEEEKNQLLDWYKEDKNSLPNVYTLQPITSRLPYFINNEEPEKKKEAQDKWWADFEMIQSTLSSAASQVLSGADKIKYLWSVTHDEIANGILQAENPDKHCYWFNRTIDDLEKRSKGSQLAGRFIDMKGGSLDVEVQGLISKLKKESIPSKLPASNITSYHVRWTENGVDPSVAEHANYLKKFMIDFYEKMTELILRGIEDKQHMEIKDRLTMEAIQHAQFAQMKCKSFHGREELINQIMRKIMDRVNRYPLVICGQPGSGKTALMAKCLQKIMSSQSENMSVIVRFIGTTSDSSSIRQLLLSVCEQLLAQKPETLSNLHGETKELTMKDAQELFVHSLTALSKAKSSLYLFLDSLDQLDDSHKGRVMDWLPLPLPKNIHVVISVIPDDKYSVVPHLKNRIKEADCFMAVPKLSTSDISSILDGYMKSVNRTLQDPQRSLLQEACMRCPIPLFLKLCVDQALKWSSFSKVNAAVLQGSVKDVINKLFERLEKYHGFLLISHGLGYITASKNGLSRNELEDILSLDDDVLNDIYQYSAPPYRRLPPLIWVRVHADLKEYLTERGADGATVQQWYHREFGEVAEERYLRKKEIREKLHVTMADYFLGKWANSIKKPFMDQKGNAGVEDRLVKPQPCVFKESAHNQATLFNHRKLSELPFHLVLAGDVETLKKEVLCNFDWLYQKTRASGFDSVLNDFLFAKQHGISDKELDIVCNAFRASIEGIAPDIGQLPVQLCGRLMSVKLDAEMANVRNLVQKCQNPPFRCFVANKGFLHPSGGAMITKLLGHSDTIVAIAVSPDKKRVVSYSSHTMIVWDMDTGLEIRRMIYDPEVVVPDFLCITKDNNFIINSCKMQLEIITIYGPEIEHKLELDHEMFHLPVPICLSPDYEKLMAMTDKSLYIWQIGTWTKLHQLPIASPPAELYTLAPEFMRGHKNLVIYFRKNTEHFYILEPNQFKKTKKYIAKVKVIDKNPGKMHCYLAATSSDKLAALVFNEDTEQSDVTLKVFNPLTGKLLKKFDLDLHAFSMSGTQVLYPKSDGNHVIFPNLNREVHPFSLTELDLETGADTELFQSSTPFYRMDCVDDDRAMTISVRNMNTIDLKDIGCNTSTFDLDPNTLLTEEITAHADNIWPLPDSTRYVAGSTALNQMFVYDLAEQKVVRLLKPDGYCMYGRLHSNTCAMFMNHTQHLVAYDLVKMVELFTLKDHCNYDGGYDFIDKDHIVYATPSRPPSGSPSLYNPTKLKNDRLKVFNIHTGKLTKTIQLTGGHPIKSVKASKNGQIIMCSVNHATYPTEDCHLVGYDLKAAKWLPKVISGKIEDLHNRGGFSLTSDGRYVLFAHPNELMPPVEVIVWDVRNGSGRSVPAHTENGMPQYPMNYLFSESLKAVVVLYNGGDVAVYDLDTLNQTQLVKTASQIIMKAHLSQDGSLFISNGMAINSILVYDLARGKSRIGVGLRINADMAHTWEVVGCHQNPVKFIAW